MKHEKQIDKSETQSDEAVAARLPEPWKSAVEEGQLMLSSVPDEFRLPAQDSGQKSFPSPTP